MSPLRVAILSYRSHPFVGGQGVYVRHLTRALCEQGHHVTVFGGQPYPQLDDRVALVKLPSLNLYSERFPWVFPNPLALRDPVNLLEYLIMCTAGFGEPRTFSLRARRALRTRAGQFDVVHDVQCLGSGLLGLIADGWPLVCTFHHPIAVDRRLDLQSARTRRRRAQLHRWYGFTGMQARVARQLPWLISGSTNARDDIASVCGVDPRRITIVPYGVDTDVFRPRPPIPREPGRIITTTSSDVPLKGLVYLLEAVSKLRAERPVRLVIIGKPLPKSSIPGHLDRLDLAGCVEWVSGIDDDQLAEQYAAAQVAVVPSLYEGFSLPAVEAMACEVPLVATTGGALPEVAGTDGTAACLVPPGDSEALADAIAGVFDDPSRAASLGAAGRRRVLDRYTWDATAAATVEVYRRAVADPRRATTPPARAGNTPI